MRPKSTGRRTGASALARHIRAQNPDLTIGQVHAALRDVHGIDVSRQAVANALSRTGGLENSGRRVAPVEAKRRAAKRARKIESKLTRRRKAVMREPPCVGKLARRNALTLVALLLRSPDGLTLEQLLDEIGCSKPTLYRYSDDVIAAGIDVLREGVPAVWRLRIGRKGVV